jgi:2-polyprenyl-3-methyl-5-hydroxy-6-metoxy-1,4-benzoquinol methylase
MGKFAQRSYKKEIMDDLEVGGEVLEQTLRELKTINRLLGGNKVTTSGLGKLLGELPETEITIADIGCGGGDMIAVMNDWAKNAKMNAHFLGIDANPNIIHRAKQNLAALSNVSFKVQNVFDPKFRQEKVDILTCTLFTHHFTQDQLVEMLASFKQKARIGIVINDLHRHPFAYYSIRLLTRFFSKSPMVKNDGPLSVLRGFRRREWGELLQKSGFRKSEIRWKWAFRWQIVAWIA